MTGERALCVEPRRIPRPFGVAEDPLSDVTA
jgi:hypothetical protein